MLAKQLEELSGDELIISCNVETMNDRKKPKKKRNKPNHPISRGLTHSGKGSERERDSLSAVENNREKHGPHDR